jgi:hypothetical protein
MDDLLALIAAIFNALTKRDEPAPPGRPPALGRALRDALTERAAAPAAPGAKLPARTSSTAPAARPPAAVLPPPALVGPTPAPAPALPAGTGVSRRPTAGAQPPEAGRVTALFADPQSLVAAFVVAEVLAKPVALRDSDRRS